MKSLIVGGILALGTALLVIGTSLLDSVEHSMRQTVTESLAGHLHVYSSEAEDELALFGSVSFEGENIGEIRQFDRIRKPLEALPNVRAVVPIGITPARFVMGNRVDRVLSLLRDAIEDGEWRRVEQLAGQIRSMGNDLKREARKRLEVSDRDERYRRQIESLDRALSDDFWQRDLRRRPESSLQFLETEIAPLASDSRLVVLRVMGTDPKRFADHFDRFRIAKGEAIPEGRRGLLLSRHIHEDFLKNPIAEGLDELHESIVEGGETIAGNPVLESDVERIQTQHRRLTFGLSPEETDTMRRRLASFLDRSTREDGDPVPLKSLITSFLSFDDSNFERRYEFFYDRIAPLIALYDIEVGDTVTVQSFSERGFTRSANVRVYGTYVFEGMEDSDLAGTVAITDLVTFRELYGELTAEERADLETLRESVGVEDVRREEAESTLFGGEGGSLMASEGSDETGRDDTSETPSETAEPFEDSTGGRRGLSDTFTREQIDEGLARSGAVVLDDPSKLESTRAAIEETIERKDLDLQVVDWQEAAGIVGQVVTVIRLVLYVAIVIVFLVALVIINNSMVMATVERTSEIGTMRAIGAQRWYVLAMFLLETLMIGVVAGLVGCGLGAAAVGVAGEVGLPATTDFLRFLFSGDRLYPTLRLWNLLFAMGLIVVVSAISTLYPARLAADIEPVVAMRGR
jgi:ABC-type lipoprotein release transport system permease subunit